MTGNLFIFLTVIYHNSLSRWSQTHWKGQMTLSHENFHLEEMSWQRKRPWVCPMQTCSRPPLTWASPLMTRHIVGVREIEVSVQGSSSTASWSQAIAWGQGTSHTLLPAPPPNFRTNRGESETLASKQSKIRGSVLWQDGGFLPPSPPAFLPPQSPLPALPGRKSGQRRNLTILWQVSIVRKERCIFFIAVSIWRAYPSSRDLPYGAQPWGKGGEDKQRWGGGGGLLRKERPRRPEREELDGRFSN